LVDALEPCPTLDLLASSAVARSSAPVVLILQSIVSGMGEGNAAVGLVGLGLMGSAMSGRLLAAGVAVVGYDPVEAARAGLAARGGLLGDSPAEVAARCGVVVLSLPNGAVSREVCLGSQGVLAGATPATIVVETSTVDPQEAVDLAGRLGQESVAFLDAGLSGNSAMVARGDTLGMVGGDAAHLPAARRVLDTFCRQVIHVGAVGDGMRAKLVVNCVLTVNRFALAEGLVLAERLGMDLGQVLQVLRASAAYSTAMDMWGQPMIDRDYHPARSRIRQHNKDALIILELARHHGVALLALSQVNHVVTSALANGLADADNAAIIEMLRALAGAAPLPPPPPPG
jgi:3-hydroxyisobutyrate dehydrogenase-like beta-hydroxyacid dehydrogenase